MIISNDDFEYYWLEILITMRGSQLLMFKIRRFLSIILIVLLVMTGCASTSASSKDIVPDFKSGGQYMFHQLKYQTPENELLKNETIKKEDLKKSMKYDIDYYVKTNEKLYGIDGKVMRIYAIDQAQYLNGGILFYFDNEQKFLEACKKMGNLLEKSFGKPDYSLSVASLNKYSMQDFMNPPDLTNYIDKYGDIGLSDYENDHQGHMATPTLTWGDNTKENILEAKVFRNPLLKNKKAGVDIPADSIYHYYFIQLRVYYKHPISQSNTNSIKM